MNADVSTLSLNEFKAQFPLLQGWFFNLKPIKNSSEFVVLAVREVEEPANIVFSSIEVLG